jgi:hypothetical protein
MKSGKKCTEVSVVRTEARTQPGKISFAREEIAFASSDQTTFQNLISSPQHVCADTTDNVTGSDEGIGLLWSVVSSDGHKTCGQAGV